MVKTSEKRIGEAQYSCTQFPARRGLAMQVRLTRLVAPLLAGLDFKSGESFMDADISMDGGRLVNTLLEHLQEQAVVQLVVDLLESCRREGRELNAQEFDMVYAGNYGELAKALLFVIETNSFFGLGPEGGNLLGLLKTLKSQVSSTSGLPANGPSGE